MLALLLLAQTPSAPPPAKPVTGVILLPSGKPAAGADLAPIYTLQNGKVVAAEGTKTDARGRFQITPARWMRGFIAYSADRKYAASLGKLQNGQRIRLQKTGSFSVAFTESGKPATDGSLMLSSQEGASFQFYGAASYQVPVPPSTYNFDFFSMTFDAPTLKPIKIKAGQKVALGPQKLTKNALAKMVGNDAAPISVAEARGVEPTVQLKDFLGKWVLLEFWGFW
jgi:hypothetical protein